MPEKHKYNPADDDLRPREYKPYVDTKLEKQKIVNDFFDQYGIVAPNTQEACERLFDFAQQGIAFGSTVEARAELIKEYQDLWMNQRVKTRLARAVNTSQLGIVVQVSAIKINNLTDLLIQEKRGEFSEKVEPLQAVVKWDDGSHTTTDFRNLSIQADSEGV